MTAAKITYFLLSDKRKIHLPQVGSMMKIIYNKIIPFGSEFTAINLFGIIFAKGHCDKVTVNHEKIHTAQMKELCYVLFYLLYVIEWTAKLVIYGNHMKAYRRISFEMEAYAHQNDREYLKERKHFAFLRYILKR
jgi:hypothetical protein